MTRLNNRCYLKIVSGLRHASKQWATTLLSVLGVIRRTTARRKEVKLTWNIHEWNVAQIITPHISKEKRLRPCVRKENGTEKIPQKLFLKICLCFCKLTQCCKLRLLQHAYKAASTKIRQGANTCTHAQSRRGAGFLTSSTGGGTFLPFLIPMVTP